MSFEYKKQVSIDSLMGVQDIHEATCPFINGLKFTGDCSSKIYEVKLDFHPAFMKVEANKLLKAIEDLDKWTNDLLNVYNELPYDSRKLIAPKIEIERIKELRDQNYIEEIKEYAGEINSLIDSWIDYKMEIIDYDELIQEEEKNIENTEKEILLKTMNEEDISELKELLDYYKNEYSKQLENKSDVYDKFERYIVEDFTKITNDFSNFLEVVRNRNDDLRSEVGELRYQIVKNNAKLLSIYQPDEFLDMTFGIKDGVVNIGVIRNTSSRYGKTENDHFNSLILGLKSKKYITFNQMNELLDIKIKNKDDLAKERKEKLINALQENGNHTIRYYKTQNDYIENKENFREKNINKAKRKIAP